MAQYGPIYCIHCRLTAGILHVHIYFVEYVDIYNKLRIQYTLN